MPFSTIFDTTIGLVLVYLVLSMVSMSVNEAIASLFRLRAKVLFAEIGRMLDDPAVRDRFWNSGLVCSLGRAGAKRKIEAGDAPSYICATSFAAALVDALRRVPGPAEGVGEPDQPGQQSGPEIASLIDKISPDSILRGTLTAFGSHVQQTEEDFKAAIAGWFDEVMDRASGVFKRYMQLISLLVALVVASAMNADTLSIARAIWQDKILQAQLVDISRKKIENGFSAANPQASDETTADLAASMSRLAEDLHRLPFRWENSTIDIWKMVGLLLTAFAMTLGAPFWFDLLSRFIKIRSTGGVADGTGRN